MKQALRGLVMMLLASVTTVGAYTALFPGVFNTHSLLGTLGIGLGLGGLAWIAYCVVGFAITNVLFKNVKNPGAVMMAALAFIGYVDALCLLTHWFPGMIVQTFVEADIFAFYTTLAFLAMWVVGQTIGILPVVKTFLPERKTS